MDLQNRVIEKEVEQSLMRQPDFGENISKSTNYVEIEKSLKHIFGVYSRQYIRSQIHQTFDSRLASDNDFNIGKFSKFLSDFGVNLPIRKINEVFNTIVTKYRTKKLETLELHTKNANRSPYESDYKTIDPFAKNLSMSYGMFKKALCKVALAINEIRISKLIHKTQFKNDLNKAQFEDYLQKIKSKTESELYDELCIELGLNDKEKYISKIKFVGQPFDSARPENSKSQNTHVFKNLSLRISSRNNHPTPMNKRNDSSYIQSSTGNTDLHLKMNPKTSKFYFKINSSLESLSMQRNKTELGHKSLNPSNSISELIKGKT